MVRWLVPPVTSVTRLPSEPLSCVRPASLPRTTRVLAVAAPPRSRWWACRPRRPRTPGRCRAGLDHDQGARLRPRPRHVAVRRRGRRAAGPDVRADRASSTTPAPTWGTANGPGQGADHRRHHATTSWCCRARACSVRDSATGERLRRCPTTAPPAGGSRRPRTARPASSLQDRALAPLDDLEGDGEFYAGGRPITLVTPARQPRLPRPAPRRRPDAPARSRPRHRQRPDARELPQGRRARSRCPASWTARRPSGPRRSRPAPTRRTRREHPRGRALPDLRHHLVPGVRRVRRGAPRLQRRRRRHPRADPARRRRRRRSRSSASSSGGWTSAGSVSLPAAPRRTRTTAGRATRSTTGR